MNEANVSLEFLLTDTRPSMLEPDKQLKQTTYSAVFGWAGRDTGKEAEPTAVFEQDLVSVANRYKRAVLRRMQPYVRTALGILVHYPRSTRAAS